MHYNQITMAELAHGIILILTTAVILGVQSTPVHVSGPDDIHVFEGESGILRCEVKNITGYVIYWQYVDWDGEGTIIGRCFGCPPSYNCTTEIEEEQNYTVGRDGDSYYLSIHSVKVLSSSLVGYYQCGYQELHVCSSSNPQTTGRYHLLQSAISYAYSSPHCNIAAVQTDESGVEFTCTWKPRYSFHAPKARLNIGEAQVEPDLLLPDGIVKRLTTVNKGSQSLTNPFCTLFLPYKSGKRSCSFPEKVNESSSVFIEPLDVDLRIGQTQRITCSGGSNADLTWIFFTEDGQVEDQVKSSKLSLIAGYVRFPFSSNDVIDLEPHEGARRGRFFISCVTNTSQGTRHAAYASVNVLAGIEHQSTPSDELPHSTTLNEDHHGESVSDLGLILVIVLPIVLIAIFFVVGFVVIWRRTHQRTYKQQPRIPDANYEIIGSTSGVVLTGENLPHGNDGKESAQVQENICKEGSNHAYDVVIDRDGC